MIKFHNVYKTYKNNKYAKNPGVEALRGVSFLIDDGEFVFIIGKSGSGKSTILKCLSCEEKPTSGTVSIDGFCVSDMSRALVPVLRRHIGMVFQDFKLNETKTVEENIAFAGEIIGMDRRSLHQKVQLVLNIVGLKDRADAYPDELSGGQKQRVAIARAMLNDPKLIIADEPTGELDPETSENIMGLLLDINRSGTTVIVCTHDANLVDKVKKRVIEVKDGIIIRDKEDSAYVDDTVEEKPLPSLPVSFGEDADYNDYDDAGYLDEKPPVGDFYFGETPASAKTPVRTPAPVPAPVQPAPAPAAVPVFNDDYDDEEVAFEDEITDISDLLIENESEPEVSETSTETSVENEDKPEVLEEPSSGDPDGEITEAVTGSVISGSAMSAPEPDEEETSEEQPVEEEEFVEEIPFEQAPVENLTPVFPNQEEKPAPAEEPSEVHENDDGWLDEVRMDDIDLDIQEDDDE